MSLKAKIAVVCGIVMCIAGVSWIATPGHRSLPGVTYSQFLDQVRTGSIAAVVIYADGPGAVDVSCRLEDGSARRTVLPADYRDALAAMQQHGVNIEIRESTRGPLRLLLNASPFLLLLAVWLFLLLRGFPTRPLVLH